MSVIDRTTKLRWRRRLRRSKRQVEDLGAQAEQNIEQHFFKRLSRLTKVRRFIAAWTMLFILLIGAVLYQTRMLGNYYLQPAPAAGGIYTEGILGSFTNANPIYAATSVDNSVARLVFAGLFKYDQNNQLVADLAKSIVVDARGTTYTVVLKDGLLWHDGMPLTADDVVYTYSIIQTPDAKSPLFTSWTGIKVQKIDAKTITFTLPSLLTAFPHSLTTGLLPKHILGNIPAAQLRSIAFNTSHPIGSGPFTFDDVDALTANTDQREQRISFSRNQNYVGGASAIDTLIIRTFGTTERLEQAFKAREVNAAAGLVRVGDDIRDDLSVREFNIPLSSEVLVFFKSSSPYFGDANVRRAFSYATDTTQVISGIGQPVSPVSGPLLRGQIGYDPAIRQNTNNPQLAAQLLDQAGWVVGANGRRSKGSQALLFTLTTQNNSVYNNVAQILKRQWEAVGAQVDILALDDEEFQLELSRNRNYDALLYGIAIGADPDVFAYWHSSQADSRSGSRLNFSEYKSTVADKSLEGGRTRTEDAVRASKYKPFLTAWRDDAPAIALYQPRYLYVAREPLFGFSPSLINSGVDRFNSVTDWKIRQTRQAIK